MAYGIVPTGFSPKPEEVIRTELEASVRGVFGAQTPIHSESLFGMLIGIIASLIASVWQALNAVYNSAFRSSAAGVSLDNVGSLIASTRSDPTYSKVDLTVSGTPGTVLNPGRIVSVTGTGVQFTNLATVTIGGGGTSTDEWRAVNTGPNSAPAGTLTTIETPVLGWASATNTLDQRILGTNLEVDSAYRIRQESDLGALGGPSARALRAKLLQITNVIDAYVFENSGDSTDANGLPPHSFEAVVDGGTDQAVADLIYENKGLGINTYGTTPVAVTDSSGDSKTINLSRPVDLNAWVTLSVKIDASLFPDDGVDQIKAALAFFGDLTLRVGSELISSSLIPIVFGKDENVTPIVVGVTDVVGLPLIGLAVTPTLSDTLIATNRQKIRLDTSRMVVNLIP